MEPLVFFFFALSTFTPFFSFTKENQLYPFPKRVRERGGDGGVVFEENTEEVEGEHKRVEKAVV
jgi:hypothetical protein